ncbi:hypothetical protein [Senegalia massiliensis]|uniref:Uncharacterized protein n=1 Tax=Senegalia massiliensis TaxID=1720316 RepID=A0A845QUM5_9CLOT|nr:hypothetical protein [Senegalia massiliensis]NBI06215.1 hypothetical protein [Senegalia massiliensis]
MTQKTGKIFIVITVILLFINLYFLIMNNKEIDQSYLRHIENETSNQRQEIDSLRQYIDELNKKSNLISSYNYYIENIGNNYEEANVAVEVKLNKLKKDSIPYLVYSIEGKDEGEKIKLNKGLGLKYSTNLNLSYSNNYNIQIIMENEEEIIAEELDPINLAENLKQRFSINIYLISFDSNKGFTYEIEILNPISENEKKLELESINADIYYRDKKVDTINIMKKAEEIRNDHMNQEFLFNDTINIEGLNDEDIEQGLSFKFTIIDKSGRIYKLDRKLY